MDKVLKKKLSVTFSHPLFSLLPTFGKADFGLAPHGPV
jgi:hypothetical protein